MSKTLGIVFLMVGLLFLSIVISFGIGTDLSYWTDLLSKTFPFIFFGIVGIGFIIMGIECSKPIRTKGFCSDNCFNKYYDRINTEFKGKGIGNDPASAEMEAELKHTARRGE